MINCDEILGLILMSLAKAGVYDDIIRNNHGHARAIVSFTLETLVNMGRIRNYSFNIDQSILIEYQQDYPFKYDVLKIPINMITKEFVTVYEVMNS